MSERQYKENNTMENIMQDHYYTVTVMDLEKQKAVIKVTRINSEVGHPESSPDFSVQILIESWDMMRKGQLESFSNLADPAEKTISKAKESEAYGEYSMFYDYLYGSTVPLEEDEHALLETEDEKELQRNKKTLEEKLGFLIASWGKNDEMHYVVSEPSQNSFKLEAQEVVENEEEIDRGVDENNNDYLVYSFTVFEDYYFDHLNKGLSWETSVYPL